MPLFDQDKMATLVSELRKSSTMLSRLADLPRHEFLSDPDKIGSTKYHFIVGIESCIDMGNHIISRNGYRIPEDYGDTFTVLSEVDALPLDFSEELRLMARFRNRLVHLYWKVDDQQLYEILNKRLGDFKIFIDSISAFLSWNKSESYIINRN